MENEKVIRVMKNALDTIAFEAKEPIIKVYAQSALDETKSVVEKILHNIHCTEHNWYGLPSENCPECRKALLAKSSVENNDLAGITIQKVIHDISNQMYPVDVEHQRNLKAGYKTGLVDMYLMTKRFLGWVRARGYFINNGDKWENDDMKDESVYNDEELFQVWLNSNDFIRWCAGK